jgi:hypothetical protein
LYAGITTDISGVFAILKKYINKKVKNSIKSVLY